MSLMVLRVRAINCLQMQVQLEQSSPTWPFILVYGEIVASKYQKKRLDLHQSHNKAVDVLAPMNGCYGAFKYHGQVRTNCLPLAHALHNGKTRKNLFMNSPCT